MRNSSSENLRCLGNQEQTETEVLEMVVFFFSGAKKQAKLFCPEQSVDLISLEVPKGFSDRVLESVVLLGAVFYSFITKH